MKEIKKQVKEAFRDYGRTLVNAGVLSNEDLKEALIRLSRTPSVSEVVKKKKIITKREAASLLGYKNTRSIDRLEKKGLLTRIKSGFIGQVRYWYEDVMNLICMES